MSYEWMTAGGGAGAGGGSGDPPLPPPSPADPPPDPPPAAEEGGDDLDALRTNNEKLKHEASSLRGRLTKAEKELETTKQAQMTDQEKMLDEAFQRGVTETTAIYASRLLEQSVLTQATGKMADPTDAVKLLDLDGLDADDPAKIDKAIDDLLTQKPHLAAVPNGPKSRIDQGPQGRAPQPEMTGDDWLRSVAGRR